MIDDMDDGLADVRQKTEEEILMDEARADLFFDETNVDRISLRIPLLQEKYARKMMDAKAKLRKAEIDTKALEAKLHEYYTTNYALKLDRRDVDKYLWQDQKWINQNKILEMRKLMVEYLQTVLQALDRASWNIGNFVRIHIFKNGG